ncbi:MAG: hypothetical protein FJ034_03970, partial [Chloroflexi bacterium]|nr:hypothetical protein [Chloroflexota bacterium]
LLAQQFPALWRAPSPTPVAPVDAAPAAPHALDTADERAAWLERRTSAIAGHSAVHVVSATALARVAAAAGDDPNLRKEPPIEEEPPWRRGRAGTAIGRAVHSVLQTIDLATGAGLEETARAQAAAEGVPQRAQEVARLARVTLSSDAVRAAVGSGRHWREVYVGALADGVLVEGFIDLLYETPDGLVVVDYKTDALRSEDSSRGGARALPAAGRGVRAGARARARTARRALHLRLPHAGRGRQAARRRARCCDRRRTPTHRRRGLGAGG